MAPQLCPFYVPGSGPPGGLSGKIWIWRPQREDLDLAASAGRFGFGGKGNNNNNNQSFRWQERPGRIICVLFCLDTRRDEEKETQNINVVGKKHKVCGTTIEIYSMRNGGEEIGLDRYLSNRPP